MTQPRVVALYERHLPTSGALPARVQVAPVVETSEGVSYATARPIEDAEEVENQFVWARNAEDIKNNGCFSLGVLKGQALIIFAAIGFMILVILSGQDPEAPSFAPTPQVGPEILVCPTMFDLRNRNVVLAECDFDGCDVSIEWCGLATNRTYQLTVSLAGDYNDPEENVQLVYAGQTRDVTPDGQCPHRLQQVLKTTVQPTNESLRLDFVNSPAVTAVCSGNLACRIRVVLRV